MDKPFSTKSESRVWDYIVIGSGMGGLATASMLSQLGHKVLIIEQHYVPGGFTHTFKRKHWVWDVGVHAIGEVTEHAMLGRLLKKLSSGGGEPIEWTSLGGVYDAFHFPEGFKIDFPDSRGGFIDNLRHAFPNEHAAIDTYIDRVQSVGASMKGYYLSRLLPAAFSQLVDPTLARKAHQYLPLLTKDVLDGITQNEHLKTVLAAQWGYYGSPPSRSSFAIHALVAKHFMHGGYYPVGGAKVIADRLMRTVAAAGGWTRISASVKQLLIEKDAVVGVELDDGEQIRAGKVVSAIGAVATASRLLPASHADADWAKSIRGLKQSPPHVCLNIGFKGDISKAGASAANQWFYETWNHETEGWDISKPDSEAPILYCSFPSLKDPMHTSEFHTGEVVTFVDYDEFAKWKDARWMKRGEDYTAMKADLSKRLLAQFLRHMPQLEPFVAYHELSTPLSTEWFTRAPRGAIYGLEPTPERFSNRYLRPRTPLKNLFMSGGDMATVGVMGAFVGGILCAAAAEPRQVIQYLRAMNKKRVRPSQSQPASSATA